MAGFLLAARDSSQQPGSRPPTGTANIGLAGATPFVKPASNQKKVAYADDLLIEKLILLARELGHFPVSGDLRLKARNESDFPSHTVFNRLGSKRQLVSKVAEYCAPLR
jgi:hypothetical protein